MVREAYAKGNACYERERAPCCFDTRRSQIHCHRLVRYNKIKSSSCFGTQLRELDSTIRKGFERLEQLLNRLVSDQTSPSIGKITKKSFF